MSDYLRFGIAAALIGGLCLFFGGDFGTDLGRILLVLGVALVVFDLLRTRADTED